MARYVVRGQRVREDERARARQLRREMTQAERVLWSELRGHRLAGLRFRRQQLIGGYIADFYCHEAALVIEVDGPVHKDQSDSDSVRDKAIVEYGIQVIRFSNDEVMQNLSAVLTTIEQACMQRRGTTEMEQRRRAS
jgi:very-short-patch-repair endonuclease